MSKMLGQVLGNLQLGEEIIFQRKMGDVSARDQFSCESLNNIVPASILISFMVEATNTLISHHIPDYYMSIVKQMDNCFINPTSKGMVLTINAKLTLIHKNSLHFDVKVYDELGIVCTGKQIRAIAERRKFTEGINNRLRTIRLNS